MDNKFVRRMIEEKGLMEETIEVREGGMLHIIEMPALVEFIENITDKDMKQKIIHTLSIIDFKNGDVMHYMNHLAKGYAAVYNHSMGM